MNPMKQCPRGHIYEGNGPCPYCETKLYPNVNKTTRTWYDDTDTVINNNGAPKTKHTAYPNTETAGIPRCPYCGKPVRRFVPNPPAGSRVSSMKDITDGKVPWNYRWDGKCENCGHDFNIVMNINMGSTGPDNKTRQTIVSAKERGFLHHLTCNFGEWCSTVLSGVEIETRCGGQYEKLFLSANELKYLMSVLQNSPIMQQLDYYDCAEGDSANVATMTL